MAKLKENILKLANENGFDIKSLEKKAGLSSGFISHILRDKSTNPGILSIIKLADTLKISLDEIAGRKRKYLRQITNNTLTASEKTMLADIFDYTNTLLKQNVDIMITCGEMYDFIYELFEYSRKSNKFDKKFADWLFQRSFEPI